MLVAITLIQCGGDLYRGFQHSSPSGHLVASFFGLGGGGAAGWAQQYVSVRRSGERFDSDSFVVEFTQAYEMCLDWPSDEELHIIYPKQASVLLSIPSSLVRVTLLPAHSAGALRSEDCPGRLGALGPASRDWQ